MAAAIAFGTSVPEGSHLLPSPLSVSSSSCRKPPPVPAQVELEHYVYLKPKEPPTKAGKNWAIVGCASRKAYGCGKHTQKVLDGLNLYQRLITFPIPQVSSTLYIQASEDALRGIRAEFAEARKDSPFAEFDQSDCEELFASVLENAKSRRSRPSMKNYDAV